MTGSVNIIPTERIEKKIYFLRGHKVLISTDLAQLYEVEPRVLVQAVKRNNERFPEDFMFQLTEKEYADLRSLSVTGNWGGSRKPPYAFTEQGVAMLSTVLKSRRAINVSIEIMRTFVRMRKMLSSYEDLARKLDVLEKKYDIQFRAVFDAIRQLMTPPDPKKKQIGFHWEAEKPAKKKAPPKKKAPAKKVKV